MLGQIKAISFDLDDTLWDCAPAISRAEEISYQWFQQHAARISDELPASAIRQARMQLWEARPDLRCDVTALRKKALADLFLKYGYPTEWAESAFDVFYAERSNVTLYEGVHDVLAALRNRHKMAAITNGNADLDIIGIGHYFDDIQRASLENAPKPHTQMFDRCLARFDLPASALLHVGDNPTTDVMGGHNAGALSVWFNKNRKPWPFELPPAHFEVRSLVELQELLT